MAKKKAEKEVEEYRLKNGEIRYRYRYKYYDVLGNRREKKESSFMSEKAAEMALLHVKSDILNGNLKKVEHNHMTIGQWLDTWYEMYSDSWEVSTRKVRQQAIRKHMKPLLGRYNLVEFDRSTYMRTYIKPLLKKFKPSTVSTYHNYFKIAINAAIEEEIITRNRFKKVNIEEREKRINFLTPHELNIFIDAAKKYCNVTGYTIIVLLAYTGMRIGEALGLKWADINFKTNQITVNCTRDSHGERSPKTKNSYRTFPVDQFVIDTLVSYQKRCLETKFKYGLKLDKKTDHVFISQYGGTAINTEVAKFTLRQLYKYLDVEGISITRITPHGLRHTHATVLINNGVPPKTIADRLGNSVEMIYKVYGHSFKEMENKAVTVFTDIVIGAKIGAD
ncbi:tyrosine-type recombinase/integrase [Paenibacillus sp. MCAF9]|uniref:tyrosine-type recombinase/integrase n=1 Tax=Paenibacillus sp. MCAF9 TaxID=3233046 RepID=UPI003F9CEE65